MTLLNIVYTPKCNFNLISLNQLCKSKRSYHNHLNSIILNQEKSIIGLAVRHKNLFILEINLKDKVILVQEKNCPTYLFSSNSQIRLQHYCFSYATNIRVVQAFKLIDKIDIGKVLKLVNKSYSSNSEPDNNSDIDIDILTASISKTTEHNFKVVKKLCKAYIKNKYTRIVEIKKNSSNNKKI